MMDYYKFRRSDLYIIICKRHNYFTKSVIIFRRSYDQLRGEHFLFPDRHSRSSEGTEHKAGQVGSSNLVWQQIDMTRVAIHRKDLRVVLNAVFATEVVVLPFLE